LPNGDGERTMLRGKNSDAQSDSAAWQKHPKSTRATRQNGGKNGVLTAVTLAIEKKSHDEIDAKGPKGRVKEPGQPKGRKRKKPRAKRIDG